MFAEAESGVTCPQGRGHRLPGRHLVSGGVSWDRPSCLPSARRLPQARGSPPCTPSLDSPPASPPRPAQRPPPRSDAGRLCRAHRPGPPVPPGSSSSFFFLSFLVEGGDELFPLISFPWVLSSLRTKQGRLQEASVHSRLAQAWALRKCAQRGQL